MHRYDKQGLICEPHPSKMPWYIIAAMGTVMAGFATYEFAKSAQPACDISTIPASEIVQGACNHPVPKP